jgi:hypothetical protein
MECFKLLAVRPFEDPVHTLFCGTWGLSRFQKDPVEISSDPLKSRDARLALLALQRFEFPGAGSMVGIVRLSAKRCRRGFVGFIAPDYVRLPGTFQPNEPAEFVKWLGKHT